MSCLFSLKIDSQEFTVELLPKDDCVVMYKIENERLAFTFKCSVQNKIFNATYEEVQRNQLQAYKSTTYIDNPDDKEDITRDNSFFDRYIMQD